MRPTNRRTRLPLLMLAATLLAAVGWADDIQKGDSAARVQEVLGEPNASLRSGGYEILQYDRGRIELRDGVVTEATLVSEEEAVTLKAERLRAAIDRRERQAVAREQRRLEGLAERDRTLASADFLAASGARQAEYWETFQKRYPLVPIQPEYAAALAKRDDERKLAEADQRLANMERRLADAEQQAREAQDAAREAQQDRGRRYVTYLTPYVDYPYWGHPPVSAFGSGFPAYGTQPYGCSPPVSSRCASTVSTSSGLNVRVGF